MNEAAAGDDIRPALVRALVAVADDLDARHYGPVGIVRQAAQLLVEDGRELAEARLRSAGPGACENCEAKLDQPAAGRRRRFCSARCRDAAYRLRNRAADETTTNAILGLGGGD